MEKTLKQFKTVCLCLFMQGQCHLVSVLCYCCVGFCSVFLPRCVEVCALGLSLSLSLFLSLSLSHTHTHTLALAFSLSVCVCVCVRGRWCVGARVWGGGCSLALTTSTYFLDRSNLLSDSSSSSLSLLFCERVAGATGAASQNKQHERATQSTEGQKAVGRLRTRPELLEMVLVTEGSAKKKSRGTS